MVTEYLLENGANPNLADKFEVTPLTYTGITTMLMKATADLEVSHFKELVERSEG